MKKRRSFTTIQGRRSNPLLGRGDLRLGVGAFAAVLAIGAFVFFAPTLSPAGPAQIEAAAEVAATSAAQTRNVLRDVRVIDGDTLEDQTTGEHVRLANIDTAETGSRAQCAAERRHGEEATREALRLVSDAHVIGIRRTGRIDRYGRTVAFVEIDGRDFGRALMDARLARPWRGRREPWCAADGSLLR